MSKMFSNSSLKTIDFYNSNTINLIEMNEMLDNCKNLKEIIFLILILKKLEI